jgi:hypothetical protein
MSTVRAFLGATRGCWGAASRICFWRWAGISSTALAADSPKAAAAAIVNVQTKGLPVMVGFSCG